MGERRRVGEVGMYGGAHGRAGDAQEQLKRDMAWLIRDFQQRVRGGGRGGFEAGKGDLGRAGGVPRGGGVWGDLGMHR